MKTFKPGLTSGIACFKICHSVFREELKEESYIYTGQAETYKMAHDSDRSSSPDSPTRLLMLGGRTNKNNKGTAKDNGQMISI